MPPGKGDVSIRRICDDMAPGRRQPVILREFSTMKKISRRDFLKFTAAAGLSTAFPLSPIASPPVSGKVVILSVDALDPRYLFLNSRGERGGRPGDYLMPNVRALVDGGVRFANARCHLPSATDMNHLNALAGTCSVQTGIFGVSAQPVAWDESGNLGDMAPPDLFSGGKSRPLDTLFAAWKREYGKHSLTLFAAGKEWVGRMFDVPGSGVDLVLGGSIKTLDIPGQALPMSFRPPERYSFYDPSTDSNRRSDLTSIYQKTFCDLFYGRNPEHCPGDRWMVDNTLRIMNAAKPGLTLLLLAQTDDLQHGLGTAYPEDYSRFLLAHTSSVNPWVIREAVLDGIRAVDIQVGRFMDGLLAMPEYRDALVLIYSDHGHVTHRDTMRANVDPFIETDPTAVLKHHRFLSPAEKQGRGYFAYTASSYGGLYFKGPDRHRRARQARDILDAYTLKDYFPDGSALGTPSPWHVFTREEMERGLPEQGILPGELYHRFIDHPEKGLWPDVMLFMKNGWQLPITGGLAGNLGVAPPACLPPLVGFLGGHGALDSRDIVMAFTGPGIPAGKVVNTPCRISDLAPTLMGHLGMKTGLYDRSRDARVAADRSGELG